MRLDRPLTRWMVVAWVSLLVSPTAEVRAQVAPVSPKPAAASDTPYLLWTPWVSPGWFPAYLLRGELFGYDFPKGALQPPLDARSVQVRVDAAQGSVTTALTAADVPLAPARTESFDQYANRLTASNLRKAWVTSSLERINKQPVGAAPARAGLSIALPVEMPKIVRSFLGDAPPALNVSGSERIAISGTSNWTNQQSSFGRKPSLFPQLDMQQDLNINVTGTLGDKVAVDVTQFSGVQSPLSNRIALRFDGDDEQVVQKMDLGNTNLSLPNTQYVSYSGRNDGLFGVMSQLKLGGTDLSVIASKQEARSERTQFQGTTQYRSVSIDDWQYVPRTYFLLQQPDSLADSTGVLRPDAPFVSDIGSVEVYVDDRSSENLTGKQPGYAEVADPRPGQPPDSNRVLGSFDHKEPIKDFDVRRDLFGDRFPVLVLKGAVPEGAILAVTYRDTRGPVGDVSGDTLRLKLLKAVDNSLPIDPANGGRYADTGPFASVREYELRNFYDLGVRDIDPAKTTIQVRRQQGGGTREFAEQFADPKTGLNLTYLELTGLDLLTQTQGGTPQPGYDGKIDRFADHSLVDWKNGLLYFPDLRPFAPRLNRPGDKYFFENRIAPYAIAPRRRTLVTDPNEVEAVQANDAPYMVRTQQDRQEAKTFYIYAEIASAGGANTLYLRNTPIVEGSEIVTVNGEIQVREKDYRINYQTGEVQLLSAKAQAAGANLSIDYSYAPLFSQASKTLIGSAVKFIDHENLSLGSAFLYEARGVQEKRPRLGEEPSRTFIGDVNGRIDLTPNFMTSFVNLLPLYDSREPSRLTLAAETGHSLPNPNTKNEVYLDDFEGARSSTSLSMDARSWVLSSPPEVTVGAFDDSVSRFRDNAELKWFNPFNVVKQRDLRPNLTRAEDSQASVNVMSWWIPQPWAGGTKDTMWVGLTQALDPDGVDLSRSQFMDIWVNDFRDFTHLRRKGVKLHFDVGLVSEDAQLGADEPPDRVLENEDLPPLDRQLTPEEDVGLDGVSDVNETIKADPTVHMNASDADPQGDDWRAPNTGDDKDKYVERDPRRWRFNNGTEKNQQYKGVPDTEDLDGDGQPDFENDFFRYTIDLGDTNYLDTDVYAKYSGSPSVPSENQPTPDNGWRRYLIPLNDPRREEHGAADIRNVKYVRVWLEGVANSDLPPLTLDPAVPVRPLIEFAQIEIVGNRWVATPIDSTAASFGQDLAVRTINNREDQAVYEPPFDLSTQTQGGSSVEEREQSLALRARDIVPGGEVSAYRPTTLPEDYSLYRAIRFYAAALDFTPQDSVRFFVRFSSDAGNDLRNYYEYSAPLPPPVPLGSKPIPWIQYDLTLTDFSDLKVGLSADSAGAFFERPSPTGGLERLSLVGRPSFTRVQRVFIGLESTRAAPDSAHRDSAYAAGRSGAGELWVDELRAVDVSRDRGSAQRVSLLTNFSDLLSLNLSVDRQDENFQRLGQARGSGNDFRNLRLAGTLGLDRFVRGLGFNVPVTFDFQGGRSLPRFRTGQDILLRGQDAVDERTTQWSRNWSMSFSHTGSKSFVLKNTLDAVSFRYSMADERHRTPTSADTARTLSGGGVYSITPRDWLGLKVPFVPTKSGRGLRFYPLPSNVLLRFDMTTRRSVLYDRFDDGSQTSRLGNIYAKDALYQLSSSWRPFDPLGYSFTSTRNANLTGIEPMRIAGINFGRQTAFNHRFDARWPFRFGPWLSPDIDGNTQFTEQRGPELSPDLSLGTFTNGSVANVRYVLPLTRLRRGGGVRDTTVSIGDFLGGILGRIGDVQARFNMTRSTQYARLTGYPSMGYRLGFDREPGFATKIGEVPSVQRTLQSSDNTSLSQVREASTQTMLWPGSSLRVAFNYTYNRRSQNTQNYETSTATWPDLSADWGQIGRTIGLSRIFPTLSAQTRYSRRVDTEGLYQRPFSARTTSTNWQPLFSLNGSTKSGIQTAVAAEYSSSLREDFRNAGAGNGSVNQRQSSTTVRADFSKTLNPGSKFKFFGLFGSNLRSTLTMSWRSSYTKRKGGTTIPGQDRVGGEINNDRIDSTVSGTYSFSRQVNGTVGVGFNQFKDHTRAVFGTEDQNKKLTQRSVRLEASAQLSF